MDELDHDSQIPTYTEHEGTLKISGSTLPRKAGSCAFHFLERKIPVIDFFCIGANSNQQAMKAMGVFLFLVEKDSKSTLSVAFQPLRFKTETTDPDTQAKRDKDCTVWRTILITRDTRNDTGRHHPRD